MKTPQTHGGFFAPPSSVPPSSDAEIADERSGGVRGGHGTFAKGNPGRDRIALASNPIDAFKRRVREIYNKVKKGHLEAHTGSVLIQCLKFELELFDRFDLGSRLAKFDAEVAELEARYQLLRSTAGSA